MSDIKWKDATPDMTFVDGSIWLLAVADEFVIASFNINDDETNTGGWYKYDENGEPIDTEPHQIAFIKE